VSERNRVVPTAGAASRGKSTRWRRVRRVAYALIALGVIGPLAGRKMIGEKTPVTEVAQVLGVSRATLYRRVPELGEARPRSMMNEPDAGVSSLP